MWSMINKNGKIMHTMYAILYGPYIIYFAYDKYGFSIYYKKQCLKIVLWSSMSKTNVIIIVYCECQKKWFFC